MLLKSQLEEQMMAKRNQIKTFHKIIPSRGLNVLATVDLHPKFHELWAGLIEKYIYIHVEVARSIMLITPRIMVKENQKGYKNFPIE